MEVDEEPRDILDSDFNPTNVICGGGLCVSASGAAAVSSVSSVSSLSSIGGGVVKVNKELADIMDVDAQDSR